MSSYVVTGASRGIGLEFVKQLSANSENKLSAAEVSKATNNKLDYLINNAGSSTDPGLTLNQFPSPEAVEKDLLDNFKSNTIGVVHTTNAFLPLLKNGSTKKVLTLSSGLGDLEVTVAGEYVGRVSYSISKAALNMVVAKYAAQYKAEGFVFLAICPGGVDTSETSKSEPTAETLKENKMFLATATKLAPDFKGPITPQESVKMQLDVFNRWTVEETGAFVSRFGNKQWL
ncbi:NAD(P)-binding protein [Mycena venus]|uniref:NAD(P)-binding protein n=1 Tax=Mycena venus TaxID=2733690 RepID=A0A8H7CR91_9AGAR|nr:NAD(P)-binding protein [Mycena venus]